MSAQIIALPTNFAPCIVEVKGQDALKEQTIKCIMSVNEEIDFTIMHLQNQIHHLRERKEANLQMIEDIQCQRF